MIKGIIMVLFYIIFTHFYNKSIRIMLRKKYNY